MKSFRCFFPVSLALAAPKNKRHSVFLNRVQALKGSELAQHGSSTACVWPAEVSLRGKVFALPKCRDHEFEHGESDLWRWVESGVPKVRRGVWREGAILLFPERMRMGHVTMLTGMLRSRVGPRPATNPLQPDSCNVATTVDAMDAYRCGCLGGVDPTDRRDLDPAVLGRRGTGGSVPRVGPPAE